ncbi:MAG: hypothetical protein JETT_1702 [Candidatus Jettenia ecosi]|uniref:Uncharacterized protein n=1 Tax=Candidatus Jettenia ecosi TaxID=2494326 RepID=A0A533QN97_9BACT|nr:MAG: hypothetical protein JETT_1702 [Candidatus Jettenia ecosi]
MRQKYLDKYLTTNFCTCIFAYRDFQYAKIYVQVLTLSLRLFGMRKN